MNFEQLANELLIDVFEYLKSAHLLRAFSQLNSRFNHLLIFYFRSHGLDFRSISKHDFERICREDLPLIADHMSAIRLSDDDDTPHQIDLFLSGSITPQRFVQLKSLSLYHLSSNEMVKKVILQFCHLPLLTHIKLINCHMIFEHKTLRNILNRIWQLPKLTHCHLDLHFQYSNQFSLPTIRSKSIEYVCLDNTVLNLNELIRLFRCTPNLRHLTTRVDKLPANKQFPFIIQSIYSLKFIVDHLTNGTMNTLKNMPNLTSLTLQTGKHHMNGQKWKEFILDYLPKLKIFRFLMFFFVDNEEEMNELLDTYRTSFWLIDRQWFVRCHWNLENEKILIYFYTLPYAFSLYAYIFQEFNGSTKSTCPNEDDYCSYNYVTKLTQHCSTLNDFFLSHIRFPNIRYLEVRFPLADQFMSVLPRLDQLIALTVSTESECDTDIALFQLQTLINRAPHLYLLTIGHWDSSIIQQLPLYLTSQSIRRLDLQSYHYLKRDRCFNSEQCAAFLHSSLGKQCEILQIVVDNRSSIDYLINEMTNLQALKVIFQSDQWDDHYHNTEEMITWMVSGYSRTFTENLSNTEIIRLWIR